jgi:hypothetical protein
MKKYLIIVCLVGLGSMVSQAAGLHFVNKANPPINLDERLQIPAWVLALKGEGQLPSSIKDLLLPNPGPVDPLNKPWFGPGPAAVQNGNGDPESGTRPSVPEPEGLGALLAMGLAVVFFGGYQVQRRRLVRGAA